MIRGDTRYFNFKIKKGEEYIDGSNYTEVEVQFNPQGKLFSLKKLKSKGEVWWEDNHFGCFLSQEDTFSLRDGVYEVQVRLFVNSTCKGTFIKQMDIGRVLSKEVLD